MPCNIKWNHEKDKQLLLAILVSCPRLDYGVVTEAFGNGASTDAIRHRIRVLKAQQKVATTPSPTKEKVSKSPLRDDKVPSTPRKRKRASSIKTEQDSDCDIKLEDEMEPRPAKQLKTSAAARDQED